MYETIQTPFNYGGLTLKNRIIFAPTTFGLSDEDYFEKIRRIAAGGCAMIIVGDVPVGKSHFGKSLFDKKGFAFYEKVIGIAHDNDCKVCAQLHQSDSNIKSCFFCENSGSAESRGDLFYFFVRHIRNIWSNLII